MEERTCALVIVGNEILSGKVQDTNAWFAVRELRKVGVTLKRIAVVPDELPAISEEVRGCAERFDVVITSGGVGPTHDDITIEGVAIAFNRPVVRNPELERIIRAGFRDKINAAALKMAEIPEGAVLNVGGEMAFPTIQLENVYMLPGIPQLFESKLLSIIGRFATDPYHLRVIYTSAREDTIAEHLNACLARFPDLLLGSYPKIGNPEYRVRLTLESKDAVYLDQAFRLLIELIPSGWIVKTE
jgi:molybdenum cofactor synthesis domain-containing protein